MVDWQGEIIMKIVIGLLILIAFFCYLILLRVW